MVVSCKCTRSISKSTMSTSSHIHWNTILFNNQRFWIVPWAITCSSYQASEIGKLIVLYDLTMTTWSNYCNSLCVDAFVLFLRNLGEKLSLLKCFLNNSLSITLLFHWKTMPILSDVYTLDQKQFSFIILFLKHHKISWFKKSKLDNN